MLSKFVFLKQAICLITILEAPVAQPRMPQFNVLRNFINIKNNIGKGIKILLFSLVEGLRNKNIEIFLQHAHNNDFVNHLILKGTIIKVKKKIHLITLSFKTFSTESKLYLKEGTYRTSLRIKDSLR